MNTKKLNRNQFNTIQINSDLQIIKKYIDTLFGVSCVLYPQVYLSKSGKIKNYRVLCKSNNKTITIYPKNFVYTYNGNIEESILNFDIINILKEIMKECKCVVLKKIKNNEINDLVL